MKRLALLPVLLVSLFCYSAYADTLNVLVYPANREISSYIQSMFLEAVLEEPLQSAREQRLAFDRKKEAGEKLAAAYNSENQARIETAISEYAEPVTNDGSDILEVKLVETVASDYDIQTIISGDEMLLRYICLENSADVLVVPLISQIGGFNHLSLYRYIFGEPSISLVYERVSADSDRYTPASMLRLCYGMTCGLPAIVRLDGMPDGAHVAVDGKDVGYAENHVLTTEGEHVIRIDAQGHNGRTIAVNAKANSVIAFDASLSAVHFANLLLDSNPSSTVSVNGQVIGQTPLTLDSYSLPLSIRFERDLYMGRNVGISQNTTNLSVELKPLWMGNEPILKRKKDAFYWAFARSLLLFGTKLALGVFNDGSNKVLSSLDMVSNGLLTVSVVDTVGTLVDYYRQTEYISP